MGKFAANFVFHPERENDSCKVQSDVQKVIVFAECAEQRVKDHDDKKHSGEDADSACHEKVFRKEFRCVKGFRRKFAAGAAHFQNKFQQGQQKHGEEQ